MPIPYSKISDYELERLLEQGKTFTEIAKIYGLTKQAVESLAKRKFGDKYSTRTRIKKENRNAIEIFRKTNSLEETSKQTGLSIPTLRRRFFQIGFKYHDRKKWTPEDIKLIKKMRTEGKKHREIGEYFNATAEHIMSVLYCRQPRKRAEAMSREEISRISKVRKEQVETLMRHGFDVEDVSKQVGISISRVYQIVREMDIKTNTRKRRNKAQMQALYEQVELARKKGKTFRQIGEMFNISTSQVNYIVRRVGKNKHA